MLRSRVVIAAAMAYLGFALAIVMTWRIPALAEFVPAWLAAVLYPIDKPNLDVLRIAHFCAVAIVTVRLIGREWPVLQSPLLRPVVSCGMHSLEIFCLGVLLSFLGRVALIELGGGFAMHALVSATGIAIMIAAATLMVWSGSLDNQKAQDRPVGRAAADWPAQVALATA